MIFYKLTETRSRVGVIQTGSLAVDNDVVCYEAGGKLSTCEIHFFGLRQLLAGLWAAIIG